MLKKIDDLPIGDLERPMSAAPIDVTAPKPPKDNSEVFTDKKALTPIPSVSLEEEFAALQNLKDHQLNLATPAIKHISGARNSVIYFNQTVVKNNDDVMNVTSPSDVNSTKYNRVDNMIIISEEEISNSFSADDGVVKNDIEGTGKVFPGFTPYVGDLFYIRERKEIGVLYQITEVAPIAQYDGTGFTISFVKFYDQISPEELDSRVEKYFVFNFDNVGKNHGVILERSLYDVYQKCVSVRRMITNEFFDRYYNSDINAIVYEVKKSLEEESFTRLNDKVITQEDIIMGISRGTKDVKIIDPYLTEFFNSAKIFGRIPVDYGHWTVMPDVPFYIGDIKDKYKFSIYTSIERKKPKLLVNKYFKPVAFKPTTVKDVQYKGWYFFDAVNSKTDDCIDVYPDTLLNRIITNTKFDELHDGALLRYNLIINFFNSKDYVPNGEELDAISADIEFLPYNEFYGLAPLLVYICAYFEEKVAQEAY